jgi:acetoin utilization protein AcuB
MLLVRDSMTREVVVLSPPSTAAEALGLCRERRIRHLPVLEGGRLVGIVSDRDLRSAAPALGDPERAAALEKIRLSDVMSPEVITAHPDDPIEVAANRMRERRIGCLPVVESGELVGIITSSDVMEALVYLVGAHEPGSRLEVVMPDRPGTLAGVAGIFGALGINIVSVVAGPRQVAPPEGLIGIFKVDTIDTREAVELLREAGYTVRWPPQA